MLKNKRGFSLTVLIIAIAVIIIITSTAIISIKNINKDRDVSEFMNDLAEVKQYVIEYLAKDETLPVFFDNAGNMISAENELLAAISGDSAYDQLDVQDNGGYYFVDLTRLGKIHLVDDERGYIINEATLNVYVTKPCEYEGIKYYTLTPYLLGKEQVIQISTPFEIVVMGNPLTWINRAELLVTVPNVKVENAEGWNFMWAKGSKTVDDFKSAANVNYFKYGDTITLNENGIYTIFVENPEKKASVRKVVVSKIDDIAPVVKYDDGTLIIDDAETGVRSIRYKIKETANHEISDAARENFPEYYTMEDESSLDTTEIALGKYLWGDENIKGNSVASYLKEYPIYYEQLMKYNAIISNADATSGEIKNASDAIRVLNDDYPQFAYNNQPFSNTERNIVVYVEDTAGNGAIYSALSRNELNKLQYVSGEANALMDAKVIINNNNLYTNNRNLTIYSTAMYASQMFITETRGASPVWEDFKETKTYEISEGDGEKIIYAFYKDDSGRIVAVYDKIILDETPPSKDAPIVTETENGISIVPQQTDSDIVDDVETQSGLSGIYQYGIKKEIEENYKWYNSVNDIKGLVNGTKYDVVTKATDKAGNEQVSDPYTLTCTIQENSGGNTVTLSPEEQARLLAENVKVLTLAEIEELPNNDNDNLPNSDDLKNDSIKMVLQGENGLVPVPKEFEYLTGTEQTGLVIKDARKNEFVWIPVSDVTTMYTEGDAKSLDHASTPNVTTTTTRWGKGSYQSMEEPNTTNYREPAILSSTSYDKNIDNLTLAGITGGTTVEEKLQLFADEMKTEFNNMIESVEKYKGFYVGRYELGLEADGKTVVCQPGKLVLTAKDSSSESCGGTEITQKWYGLYNACKGFTIGGAKSGMIWGCQWDAMVNFIDDGGDHTAIKAGPYRTGQNPNGDDEKKNVHDTSANVRDWTASAHQDSSRAFRGGYKVTAYSAANRRQGIASNTNEGYGSRTQLYIR